MMRIGGSTLIPINVRIIATTNEDLERLIDKGTFRKDLYYRINNFTIKIPQLKDRRGDIPCIIKSIMVKHNSKKQIGSKLMDFLMNYEWPGNVRELKNCIEYLILMGDDTLTINDLPPTIRLEKSIPSNKDLDSLSVLFNEEKEIVDRIIDICTHRCIGREALHSLLSEQGYYISHYKLRKLLYYLRDNNIISFGKGRSGIKVTE